MNTYWAYFYTNAAYACTAVQASSPQEALEKAKARYESEDHGGLTFNHSDVAQPVNHIQILDIDHHEVAGWCAADLLLRMAAPDMLSLLKRLNEAFYVKGTRKALLPVMQETKPLIARAEGR